MSVLVDIGSGTWLEVKKMAEDSIQDSHNQISKTGLNIEKTEFHRGRIAAMRELLELASPIDQPLDMDDGEPYSV